MTAAQYVTKYHSISVAEYKFENDRIFAGALITTPVDEYLNMRLRNRAGYEHADRWKFRGGILKFLAKHAEMPDTPVYKLGKGYKILNSIVPLAYVDDDMMDQAFFGKGSPGTLQAVIQAISYWRGWRVLEGGTPALPALVEMFLGTDCNGFVGNYMKEKYKDQAFRLGPSTPEDDYFYNRQSIRDAAEDIQADDIVLLNRKPDLKKGEAAVDWTKSKKDLVEELSMRRSMIGHIMVISSVLTAGGKNATVMMSESASSDVPDGGPRTRPCILERTGTYRWRMVDRPREVHSIIKVKRTG